MKTSILASLAFAAALVPSLAGAANLTYDPSAGSNDPRFIESPVPAPVTAEAPKASTAFVTAYDPSADSNDPRFISVDAVKAEAPVIGTHDAAPRFVTSYDPSADENQPRFVTTP